MPAGSRSLLAGTLEQNEDIDAVITCNYVTPTIPNKKCRALEKCTISLNSLTVPVKFIFCFVASKQINSEVPHCCQL